MIQSSHEGVQFCLLRKPLGEESVDVGHPSEVFFLGEANGEVVCVDLPAQDDLYLPGSPFGSEF
jgi:hypothetical protein